jgi:hypothetical protein
LIAAGSEIDEFDSGFAPGLQNEVLGLDITVDYFHAVQKI